MSWLELLLSAYFVFWIYAPFVFLCFLYFTLYTIFILSFSSVLYGILPILKSPTDYLLSLWSILNSSFSNSQIYWKNVFWILILIHLNEFLTSFLFPTSLPTPQTFMSLFLLGIWSQINLKKKKFSFPFKKMLTSVFSLSTNNSIYVGCMACWRL